MRCSCLSTSPPNLVVKHHLIVSKMKKEIEQSVYRVHYQKKDKNACLSNMISQTETFDDEIKLE